jgi:hypothetical protein
MTILVQVARKITAAALVLTITAAPAYSASEKKIAWSEPEILIEAIPGSSAVIRTSFVAPIDADALGLWLTPGLAQYIEVQPKELVSSTAGIANEVTLFVSIPVATPPEVFDGTLHIRNGQRTISNTLKISLSLSEPSAQIVPDSLASPSVDQIVEDPALPGQYFVADEIVLGFADDTTEEAKAAIVEMVGGVFVGADPAINIYQVRLIDELSIDDALILLQSDTRVVYSTRRLLASTHLTPDDPAWVHPLDPFKTWAQTRIGLPEAWQTLSDFAEPKHPKIAIVDTGFDILHEDLDIRSDDGPNILDPTLAGVGPSDLNLFGDLNSAPASHGTWVAGTVAARPNNKVGIAGVLWDADVLLYPAASMASCKKKGECARCGFDPAIVKKHMQAAIDAGAKVINFSGGALSPNNEERAIRDAATYYEGLVRDNPNVLFVFSAGNLNTNVKFQSPARLALTYPDNVIAVAASNRQDGLADYDDNECAPDAGSNWGEGITVAAPGDENYSTVYRDPVTGESRYRLMPGGTSTAAPFVTGLAGLLLSIDDQQSPAQLRDQILKGAQDADSPIAIDDGHGNTFHVINAAKSIELALIECADGKDNDGDGLIDLDDPGCLSTTDDDESNDPTPPGGDLVAYDEQLDGDLDEFSHDPAFSFGIGRNVIAGSTEFIFDEVTGTITSADYDGFTFSLPGGSSLTHIEYEYFNVSGEVTSNSNQLAARHRVHLADRSKTCAFARVNVLFGSGFHDYDVCDGTYNAGGLLSLPIPAGPLYRWGQGLVADNGGSWSYRLTFVVEPESSVEYAIVANWDSNPSIVLIDTSTGLVAEEIPSQVRALDMEVSNHGRTIFYKRGYSISDPNIYALSLDNRSVSVLSTEGTSVPLPLIYDHEVSPDGSTLYFTGGDRGEPTYWFVALDVSSGSVKGELQLPASPRNTRFELDAEGHFAYLTGDFGQTVIDARTMTVDRQLPSALFDGRDVEVFGSRLYLAGAMGMSIIDLNTDQVIYNGRSSIIGRISGTEGIAASTDGSKVFAIHQSSATGGWVTALDTSSSSIENYSPLGFFPGDLELVSDDSQLYVVPYGDPSVGGNVNVYDSSGLFIRSIPISSWIGSTITVIH